MNKLFLLLIVSINVIAVDAEESLPAYFDVMSYLDRNDIVKHKVSQVTVTVSLYDHDNPEFDDSMSEEEIENIKTSCFKELYRFDKKGNLTGHTIQRVGSWVVYQYDEYDNIVRFGWQNKRKGTLELAEKRPKDLLDTQLQYESDLASKSSMIEPHERVIVDNCSNVDGVYKIFDSSYAADLPKQSKAKLLKNARTLFKRDDFKSPEMLYVYFDYKFEDYVELDWSGKVE